MRRFPLILALAAAAALGVLAATALWGGEPALQSSPAAPLETIERITGRPQPGLTPGGKGLPPPRVRLLQNIRNFSVRDLVLDDPEAPRSVTHSLDRCGPCGLDNPIYADLTSDFSDDVVVPIVDRGGRVTDVFIYTRVGDRIKQVFARHSPDMTVDLTGKFFTRRRDLLIFDFTRKPGDRPCCPSEVTQSRYGWNGQRFVRESVLEL